MTLSADKYEARTSEIRRTGGDLRRWLPAVAGVAYLAAWAIGLAIWPHDLGVNSPAQVVTSLYSTSGPREVVQFALVEGVAGLLFSAVLLAARSNTQRRQPLASFVLATAAVTASLTSLTQCVLGFLLIGAASQHHTTAAGSLLGLINRLDGVKMLLLAVAGAALVVVLRSLPESRATWGRRGVQFLSFVAAIALVVSGIGYISSSTALASTVDLSGSLLLLWICTTGIWAAAAPAHRHTAPRTDGHDAHQPPGTASPRPNRTLLQEGQRQALERSQ